ncbi:MAG: methyltransferase [Phenylobacterium sp.]|nr:methyltransferase [Phenylobacterium sp.]
MTGASAYVSAQQAEQRAAEARAAKLESAASHMWEAPPERLPPVPLMQTIGSHSPEHFRGNSVHFFKEIASRLQLSESSKVLDLGCGCGRMAIPFVEFLDSGRLYGCDVWPEGIAWCNANLTGKGNAEFHVQHAANNYYFQPFDEKTYNAFSLDWLPDSVLDASYAISVYTHLVVDDVRIYLSEISRATKTGGLAYFTFFMIDKYFMIYRERTGQHTALVERAPGCFHAYAGQDFFGGFTARVLRSLFDETGWDIVSFELGSWANKPGARNYQDTFILEKRS